VICFIINCIAIHMAIAWKALVNMEVCQSLARHTRRHALRATYSLLLPPSGRSSGGFGHFGDLDAMSSRALDARRILLRSLSRFVNGVRLEVDTSFRFAREKCSARMTLGDGVSRSQKSWDGELEPRVAPRTLAATVSSGDWRSPHTRVRWRGFPLKNCCQIVNQSSSVAEGSSTPLPAASPRCHQTSETVTSIPVLPPVAP
jgi:hypothetical protein